MVAIFACPLHRQAWIYCCEDLQHTAQQVRLGCSLVGSCRLSFRPAYKLDACIEAVVMEGPESIVSHRKQGRQQDKLKVLTRSATANPARMPSALARKVAFPCRSSGTL